MSLRVLTAALVLVGAVAALLFGASRHSSHAGTVQDGVRPVTLPTAPQGPAGTVVYGRSVPGGAFRDATRGLSAVSLQGPDRITILQGVTTCCMAWSSARSVLTVATEGATGPALGVVTVGSDTYRPLAFGGRSVGLVPGGWSKNGRRLAVSRIPGAGRQPAGVYVAQWGKDTFRLVERTPPGDVDRVLSMSPDGSRALVFRTRTADNPGGDGVLYTVSVMPHHPALVRLTPPGSYSWCCHDGSPASWSPDGRRVAFAAFDPGTAGDASRSAVFVAGADSTQVRRISPWAPWTTTAAWSPTGRWIAFDRVQRPPNHGLVIEHPDGSGAHAVETPSSSSSCCAQWTQDGRYLVYEHGTADHDQALYLVGISGSPASRPLTAASGSSVSFVVTGSTGG